MIGIVAYQLIFDVPTNFIYIFSVIHPIFSSCQSIQVAARPLLGIALN